MENDFVTNFGGQGDDLIKPIELKEQPKKFRAQFHIVKGFIENFTSNENKIFELITDSKAIPTSIKSDAKKNIQSQNEQIIQNSSIFAERLKKSTFPVKFNEKYEQSSVPLILSKDSIETMTNPKNIQSFLKDDNKYEEILIVKGFDRNFIASIDNMQFIALSLNRYKLEQERLKIELNKNKYLYSTPTEEPPIDYIYKGSLFNDQILNGKPLFDDTKSNHILNRINLAEDFPRSYYQSLQKTLDISWLFGNHV